MGRRGGGLDLEIVLLQQQGRWLTLGRGVHVLSSYWQVLRCSSYSALACACSIANDV